MPHVRKPNTHIIQAVSFPDHRSNDGPLDCTCGESMLASEFKEHRAVMNAARGTQESDLPKSFSLWRRSKDSPGKTF